jgi:hypothetical protein
MDPTGSYGCELNGRVYSHAQVLAYLLRAEAEVVDACQIEVNVLYAAFPSLFPIGRGLGAGPYLEGHGLRRVLSHYTGAFAGHFVFVATIAGAVANELLRRATLHASTLQQTTWTGATGDRVRVCALLHSHEYNGKEGVIDGFDDTAGRYIVRVVGLTRRLRVKASNLVQGELASDEHFDDTDDGDDSDSSEGRTIDLECPETCALCGKRFDGTDDGDDGDGSEGRTIDPEYRKPCYMCGKQDFEDWAFDMGFPGPLV